MTIPFGRHARLRNLERRLGGGKQLVILMVGQVPQAYASGMRPADVHRWLASGEAPPEPERRQDIDRRLATIDRGNPGIVFNDADYAMA